MEPITPFDWHRIFVGNEPPLFFLEIVFRVVVIYLFTVLLLRIMGKRANPNLSPFQTVVIIALGSATGDTMFYPQVPILYACGVIAVVVLLDRLMAIAQLRFKPINVFLEGEPMMVIREGRVVDEALRRAAIRPDEFLALLRQQGIDNTGTVRYAFLERSGQLGFHRYDPRAEREGRSTFPLNLSESG